MMSSSGINNDSSFFSNTTQSPDDVYGVVVSRYWYTIVGIIGLSGNTLTLVVKYCSKSKLKAVHIGIMWLAIVDLLGCMTLPIRYFYFFDARNLSATMCSVSPIIIIFLRLLSSYSLVPIAIERFQSGKEHEQYLPHAQENPLPNDCSLYSLLLNYCRDVSTLC